MIRRDDLHRHAPGYELFQPNMSGRNRRGFFWQFIFLCSTIIGIVALGVLLLTILNQTFGYASIEYKVHPSTFVPIGKKVDELTCQEVNTILIENISANRYKTILRQAQVTELSQEDCVDLVIFEVAKPVAKATWTLSQSLLNEEEIRAITAKKYPQAELVFKQWLTNDFLTSPQSSDPLEAGIRTAILGSMWIILIVIVFTLPIGVGAAIYLEEYATQNRFSRFVQTNINNLAGVPSIIYGMLGLAFFVRVLEPATSGSVFGYSDPTTASGRTILSAGLTLSLLILPVIIINAQEAIKAVPNSLREASYGMGATKWQTIWHHILPNAIPGILTGMILAVSRAFGETAPLVVVGASTYITFNPENIFSKFTSLPIQVYQWTARPQDAFQNIAAAAIIALLVLLLTLNAAAILFRNRYSRRNK